VSESFENRPLPRPALVGAALLIGLTLVAAAGARWSGVGKTQLPPAQAVGVVELRFLDRSDGAVEVRTAVDEQVVAVLDPGTNGFARGVLRGMARERRSRGVDATPPFRLVRWSDGRLSLEDPSTQREIALEAFGPTNSGAFAELFTLAEAASSGRGAG
jgi:putative photosynthetic complex assembly protein